MAWCPAKMARCLPMIDWSGEIKHFKPSEFACPCGECGSDGSEMDSLFMAKLDDLRERLGFALIVTSGYRCPAYNSVLSTTGLDGPHTTGRAADISLSGDKVHRLLTQSSLGGWFTGIGLYQKGPHLGRFVHLDDLLETDHPRPRVWTY